MLFQHAASVTRRALTLSAISLLLIGAYSNAFAQKEKVFRWSSAGDFLTFDVHAQNESLNSAANARYTKHWFGTTPICVLSLVWQANTNESKTVFFLPRVP